MRKLATLLLPLLLLAGLIPASGAAAASATVSGTLVSKDELALGPNAVAMITIVDQQASPDAGVIVGSQRVDGAQLPLAFSVPYDETEIDPGHSYAIYASITDDTLTLQNVEPVPVITGGPTSGVTVEEVPLSAAATATVNGTITRLDKTALGAGAAAYAALINEATGTMVAREAIPSPAQASIPFAIHFDPGVIDHSVTYLVRAGIVDGTTEWSSEAGVPAIVDGVVVADVTVAVVQVAGTSPTPTLAGAHGRAHLGANGRAHAGTDREADREADPGAHARAHAGTDREADPGAHAGTDREADPGADPGADRDNRERLAHAGSPARPSAHADPFAHAVADTHAAPLRPRPALPRRHHRRPTPGSSRGR